MKSKIFPLLFIGLFISVLNSCNKATNQIKTDEERTLMTNTSLWIDYLRVNNIDNQIIDYLKESMDFSRTQKLLLPKQREIFLIKLKSNDSLSHFCAFIKGIDYIQTYGIITVNNLNSDYCFQNI